MYMYMWLAQELYESPKAAKECPPAHNDIV